MLQLFSSGLMALWLEMAGMKPVGINATQLLVWQGVPLLALSTGPDPAAETTVQQYLRGLSSKGTVAVNQGVWMQSGASVLNNHQGTVPVSAASLTKVATTLAALETWGPGHKFETVIGATGPVKNGVLQGDLVVTGSGDPFFVWEEAIAVGNALNRLGIRRVAGNLVIARDFYMNYQPNPYLSGILLKQALDSATWPKRTVNQFLAMPPGTPRPQIAIAGAVKVANLPALPYPEKTGNPALFQQETKIDIPVVPKQILLLRHQSMSLAQILKQMNIYSNNEMAQMLAQSLGGASAVSQIAAKAGGFPSQEIHLVNGSGLGVENRISPRAVCTMLKTIQNYLQPMQLNVADLFPVAGRDRQGTLHMRHIPNAAVVKTGTLNEVSALAGVMPTRDRGLVWFAIVNQGKDVETFRQQQDQLLQSLLKQWGVSPAPPAITPSPNLADGSKQLGDASRNQIMSGG